ncbi:HPF/RaiA family ribosome-associated protein [Flavobacterium sp. J27]|uniref:HPF/RaiA family ribosome-associated protein n=1 Tax=Flavobacterium sp. J27 TaxID=2060419 RepID=UPI00102FF701|nr:HPF/RaiA family ribosome-associated protein [Flavobacterium sp. J27]
MQIQINTDKNIEGNERLVSFYSSEIREEFAHFDDKITRVEVHFKDENSDKVSKNDKKCLLEVRIAKKEPIVVTEHGDTIEKAFSGAVTKMKRLLISTFEKMHQH